MGLLSDKVCLVTGAASNPGLGHAIAHCFGAEGATVIATDVDLDGAIATAESIQCSRRFADSLAPGCYGSRWMAGYHGSELKMITVVLTYVVNNAGIAVLKRLEDITLEDYNRQMVVNMTSLFLGTQSAVAMMRETGTKGFHHQHVVNRCAGRCDRGHRLRCEQRRGA